MYSAITKGIKVTVTPQFLEEESDPDRGFFFWAYTVEILNLSAEQVTLRTRHWRITDANGQTQEVHGAGVVGEEPELEPGEAFEYTSGAPLKTPSGIMVGSYGMETQRGSAFDVEIPAFSLDSPHNRRVVN